MKHIYFIVLLFALSSLHWINCTAQSSVNNFEIEQGVKLLESNRIYFEENKGQVTGEDASKVKFTYNSGGLSVFVLDNGISYQFTKIHYPEGYSSPSKSATPEERTKSDLLEKDIRKETYRMDVVLKNANPSPRITTQGKSSDYTQYYTQNSLDVHHYSMIISHNVYPNIDWVIYMKGDDLKYDFIVHPGGNPNDIKLETKWVEDLKLNSSGDLVLKNRMGEVIENQPVSFQEGKEIKTAFGLNENEISFIIGEYDVTKDITIDPLVRLWGTYCGGSDLDEVNDCATDSNGDVYIAGRTSSTSSIASGGHDNSYGGGSTDAFLVKYSAAGVRLWGTYYGGSLSDFAYGCATDASDNVYICGPTYSTSSIASGGHQNTHASGSNNDAFLVKFNSAGTRLWATYYGGTSFDNGDACATDASGNVYMTGGTESNGISTGGTHQTGRSGSFDAYVVKFNAAGTRQWCTYYGGNNEDKYVYGCATDPSGHVYIAGRTESSNNIASGGAHQTSYGGGGVDDAFLAKFNTANGTRLWSTYYGTATYDYANDCATDPSGNVYLVGGTSSTSGIASGGHQNTNGGSTDGFLVKFNSTGTRQWGTYYGGTTSDILMGCTTDASGNVYTAGWSASTSGIASGGFQNTLAGGSDNILVKFNSAGVRQWGTYYGGADSETDGACAVDASGSTFLGATTKSSTGIANLGHDNTYGGGTNNDGFVVKFVDCLTETNTTTNTAICENATKPLTSSGAGGGTWSIVSGGGTISGTYTYNPANITAATTVVVRYVDGCGNGSNVSFTVNPLPGTPGAISGTTTPCNGVSTTYSISAASAATSYTWTYSGGGTPSGSGTSVTLSPTSSGTLSVTATNSCGNSSTTTLAITVVSIPAAPSTPTGTTPVCNGSSGNYAVTAISGATSYTWSYSGTGTPSGTGITTSMTPTTSGNLTVTATNACGTSSASSPLAITVTPIEDATFTYSANTYCISGTDPIPTITGVTGGTFTINNGGTINSSTGTIDLDANGVQNYIVTYTTPGTCAGVENIAVSVTAGPQATFSYTGTPYCGGTGTAAVTYGAGGSAGAFAPVTPTTDLVINSTTGAVDLNASLPGTYTIENDIVASGGCAASYATSDITITAQEDATYSYGGSTTFCENATNPTATITGTTGGAFTSTPTGLTVDGATGEIDLSTSTFGAGSTSYTVRYITPGTCSDTLDILVTLDPSPTAPTAGTTAGSNTICEGESADITASGSTGTGVTYAVFDAMTAGTNLGATPLTVSPTSTTTYYVESFNSNGCANVGGRQAVTVTVNPTPSIDAGADETICPTDNVILTVTGTGTVVWSTAETTSSITVTPLVTTTYGVTLTDANTCTNTDSVEVTVIVNGGTLVAEEDAFTTETDELINMDVLLNDIYGGNTTTIILIPNNGTATATINGSIDYQSDPDFIGTDSLVYEICDVTCAAICDTAVVIITVDKKIDFSVPGGFSPNGDNINDVFVIQGLEEYPNNSLSIFNRWGNIIYQAVPYSNDWDGSATEGTVLMGDKVTTGTYFYILELGEGIEPLRGSIEIKRD